MRIQHSNKSKINATSNVSYDRDKVWDIANDFSGFTYPITDSFDHDTLLEMRRIAEACNCSLEEAAQIMIEELGFEPEDVDIDKLSGGQDVDDVLSACGTKKIEGSYEAYGEYDPEDYEGGYTEWELIDTKSVRDSDGFMTDYTMWHNPITDMWVCIFGDRDIYYPENADYDWECETEEECRDWFDNYVGPGDEDEDIYMSTDMNEDDIEGGCGSKKKISSATDTSDWERQSDDLDVMISSLDQLNAELQEDAAAIESNQMIGSEVYKELAELEEAFDTFIRHLRQLIK